MIKTTLSLPSWDLSDLFKRMDDPNIRQHQMRVDRQARRFYRTYHGKIISLNATVRTVSKRRLWLCGEIFESSVRWWIKISAGPGETVWNRSGQKNVLATRNEVDEGDDWGGKRIGKVTGN